MSEVTERIEEAHSRRFRPYPQYKDSGVEWLGEVPLHWAIAPVYARYEVALGKMLDAKRVTGESSGKYLRNVDVQWDAINVDDLPEMDFPPSERSRYLLRPRDLLVCEGGDVGRTAIWNGGLDECFYQKAIHRVRPWSDSENPRFFYFLMYALAKRGVFTAGGNPNTIDHLTAIQLRHYRVPFPASNEQRAIAAFLDREIEKINALVTRNERLIELLQEKRAARITRAVTRGLDPNLPMKDSGVEWLGKIPAHWETKNIKRLFRHTKHLGFPERTVLSVYREYGVIEKSSRDDNFNRTPEDLDAYQLVNPGDLVINKMKAWQGSLGISSLSGITSPDYVVYTPDHEANERFLHHFLRCKLLASVYLTISNGIRPSQWRLEPERFEDLIVFLPPPAEQDQIATFVDAETTKIDALVAKICEAIDCLMEFRTALISAAVTGKIDVREAMPG